MAEAARGQRELLGRHLRFAKDPERLAAWVGQQRAGNPASGEPVQAQPSSTPEPVRPAA